MFRNLARLFIPLLLCALAGCVTNSTSSAALRLYEMHGNYNVALGLAVNYSESAHANPNIVHSLRQANDIAAPAFHYAEAYLACAGGQTLPDPATVAANPQCRGLDLSPAAVQRNSGILAHAASQIYGLLRSAVTNRLLGGR